MLLSQLAFFGWRSLCVISDNMLLFVRIIARDESQGGFSGAKIDRLVRHVGFDINEISLLTDNRILQLLPVARIHLAFEQINGGFIALMQVRFGSASRRYNDQIHRNIFGASPAFRDTYIVR